MKIEIRRARNSDLQPLLDLFQNYSRNTTEKNGRTARKYFH